MGKIILFSPVGDDCVRNLEAYVTTARALPHLVALGIKWGASVWDLRRVAKPTRAGAPVTVAFEGKRLNAPGLTGPMGDFARAYVAFAIAKRPGSMPQVGKFTKPVIMMRRLAAIMAEQGLYDPADVTPEMLDTVVQTMKRSGAKPGGAEQNAKALRWVADELMRARLLRSPFEWSPGHGKASKPARIAKQGADRMLSRDELEALAEAFFRARTPREQVVTGVLALLCCAPARISEVLRLPVDCDAVLDPGDGYQAGLRWWPAKGGAPQVKFVPKAMIPVAQEALRRIRRHTDPARHAACAVLEGRRSFSVVPPGWPHLPGDSKITYDRALMIAHPYTLADVTHVDTTTIAPITYHQIQQALSGLKAPKCNKAPAAAGDDQRTPSIFDTVGITMPDGSPVRINTHKLRHYLNTIANRAAVPQADIALWSGRKTLQQNSTYDHETGPEMVARVRARHGSEALPVDDRSTFDVAQIKETAHTTEFGWCLQSLRQNPCEMFGSCLDCSHLVCVKGAEGKLANIRRALNIQYALRDKAQSKIDEGLRVSPRWMDLFARHIARIEALVAILESSDTVDGSPVTIADVDALPRFDVIEPGKARTRLLEQSVTPQVSA